MGDWITLDELGDYMNVDEMWLTSAELAIDAAEQAVRKYLDQQVTYVEGDLEYRDGTGRCVLRLKERPVRGVISITIDDGEELVEGDDFFMRGAVVNLLNGQYFTYGRGNIVIEYDHGWDADDPGSAIPYPYLRLPRDIEAVTLSIAKRRYLGMNVEDDGKVSETIGQYSYTRGTSTQDMPKDVTFSEAAILDRYRATGTPKV